MKTLKINKLILLLLSFVLVNSCVQDDDFDSPDLSFQEPNITNLRTLASLGGDLAQEQSANDNIFDPQPLDYSNEADIVSYVFNTEDEYISGYIVSSDEAGNYFEELIIQDEFENPTIGIKLLIDVNPLFTKYEVGRKVFVKINGLSVGITNGVLTLGTLNGDEVDKIASSQETAVIQRSNEVATIVPLPLSIEEFTEEKTNMMITIADAQFKRSEVIDDDSDLKTYASSQSDQFDGERTLESCNSSATTIFSTSTFADFKGLALPTGRGSLNAILSRNFEGDAFIVSVNTPEGISFDDNAMRCDPFNPDDYDIVFEEDFTSGFNNGWDVINTTGTKPWEADDFGGDFYARGSAFVSGGPVANMVSWLISPSFDFDAQAEEQMVLEIADAFSDPGEEPLSIYYSTDYISGNDPSTATWIEIGADEISALPINEGFFDNEFDSTGLLDLSTITGTGFIAFVYDSDNGNISSTRDIGNVKILTPQ